MKMDSRGYENLYIPGAARCGNLGERASVLSPASRGTWLGPEKLHSDGGGDSCEKKKVFEPIISFGLGHSPFPQGLDFPTCKGMGNDSPGSAYLTVL